MELLRPLSLIGLLTVLGFGLYWVKEYRDKTNYLNSIIADLVDCNSEMKRTLLSGLVARFSREETNDDEISLDFERFVAKILRVHYGGRTSVTRTNADFGISIEYWNGKDLYLGQTLCGPQDKRINYEPLAIIHSQMLKREARGGFVISTSDFTPNAKKYAQDLGIELVDGAKLIDLWVDSLKTKRLKKLETQPQQA